MAKNLLSLMGELDTKQLQLLQIAVFFEDEIDK